MNNKKNKISLALTAIGLFTGYGTTHAQQPKQETSVTTTTVTTGVKNEVAKSPTSLVASSSKTEDSKKPAAPVTNTTTVTTTSKTEDSKKPAATVTNTTTVTTTSKTEDSKKLTAPVANTKTVTTTLKTEDSKKLTAPVANTTTVTTSKTEDSKKPAAPVANTATVTTSKTEDSKKLTAPVANTTTVTTTSKTEDSKKLTAPIANTTTVTNTAPEAKKTEKFTKMVISKSFAERSQLVEKYGKGKGLIVGLFPGSNAVVDTTSYMGRYLPFVNYLTNGADELVSFVPEISVAALKDKAIKKEYDLFYINAETAAVAIKHGYEPLGQRTDKIISVVLTKKNSNISKIQDLSSVKVGAIPQAMVSTLAKARFKKDNVKVDVISGGLTGQQELVLGLDNDSFDAVVMREENASVLISKNPEKYKVAIVLDDAPGFILLAKKDLSPAIKENLTKSLLALKIENPNDKAIIDVMDAKSSSGAFMKMDLKEIQDFENKIKE